MEVTVSYKFVSEAEAIAHLGGTKAAAATSTTKPTTDKAAPSKPKNTREAMVAVMNKLKAESSADACRAIIKDVSGKEQKMADLPDANIDAVFDAATAALAAKAAADAEEV